MQRRASLVPGASRLLIFYCVLLSLTASLSAKTLTGTVNNGTTGKPAAGDSVVLISLGQGMKEVAHTRTNPSGHFSFHLPDAGQHLVRAIHQGVTYHSMAPAGTRSISPQRKARAIAKRLRKFKECRALPPADLDALIQLVTVLGFMFGFMRPAVLRQDRKSAANSASRLARLVVSRLPSAISP